MPNKRANRQALPFIDPARILVDYTKSLYALVLLATMVIAVPVEKRSFGPNEDGALEKRYIWNKGWLAPTEEGVALEKRFSFGSTEEA